MSNRDLPEVLEPEESDTEAASTQPEAAVLPDEAPRSRLGLLMSGGAGALWVAFMLMRCEHDTAPRPPSAAVGAEGAPAADDTPVRPEPPAAAEPAASDPNPAPGLEGAPTAGPQTRGEEPRASDAVAPTHYAPRPQASSWARNVETPPQVEYRVRRGGSLKNVANLYKIYHHEITALNPGVSLEQELAPSSAVTVYRAQPGGKSASVGLPSDGALEGGVPMPDGPGRILKMIGWKSFGTANTVAVLDRVLRQWAKQGHEQPIIVGNLSSRDGGRLPPHSTHQSGRDVDLAYPQVLPPGEELNWRVMDDRNLDPKETWALLSMLAQTGQLEVVYIDRSVQKLLHAYAVEAKLMSKAALRTWMEYPAPTGSGSPVIQHVRGHADHLHVRFRCQRHETRCRSRNR